jgi:pimeloyl-ACP methyl ester carboxylesterase
MRPSCAHTAAGQSSDKAAKLTGILLIHSAWHGPWCWGDFAKRLAQRGHDIRAVELRRHDRSPGRIWYRVRDYVEDLRHAAAEFASPPGFGGHSLGGLLAQKYLERHPGAGLVLMASIAPGGTIGAVARLAVRRPMLFLKTNLFLRLRPFITTRSQVLELFFTPDTPEEGVDRCFVQLQDESYLAFIDTMLVRPRPHRVKGPVLVLGAERDAIFTVREVQATARAYQQEPIIFPGMGHDMMRDSGWQKVVDCVDTWIREHQDAGQVRCEA